MKGEGSIRRPPRSSMRFLLCFLVFAFLLLPASFHIPIAHAQSPGFTVTATWRGQGLPQGSSDNYNTVTVASLNGFSGNANLEATVFPILSNGPVVSFSIQSVSVSAGQTGSSQLVVSTVSSTPVGNYTATITATSGSISNSTSVWILVSVPYQAPDIRVVANPSVVIAPLSPHTVEDVNSTLTVTSLDGFYGTVSLSFRSDPGPAVIISPSSVALESGGEANATLTIQPYFAGNYSVLVNAAISGSPGHSITVVFNVLPPASDVAVLDYQLTYNAKPVPGGTLALTNSFTSRGAALITVTSLTFNIGFGSFSQALGLPLNLTSGENRILPVTIHVPLTATLGNQSLLATVEWRYYAPSQGFWFQGVTRYQSGSIVVSESPNSEPANPMGRLTGLIANIGPWLFVTYIIAAVTMSILVIRQDRKKRNSTRPQQLSMAIPKDSAGRSPES